VRLALGASPAEVARGVLLATLGHAGLGVVVGTVLALAVGRVVEHLLVGVSAHDVRTLAAIAFVMMVAAMAAALFPALKAARIDPASALRTDQ
jgi:ABC-type antimicrobial peptide transport system permease subunit